MTAWLPMLKDMRGLMKPKFVGIAKIDEFARKVRPDVSRATLYRWINDMEKAGLLRSVSEGLYANMLAQPQPAAAAAAGLLRKGAVVSLQSALNEAGMDNNPSAIVTAIIPVADFRKSYPKPGELTGGFGRFRFYTMPAEMFSSKIGHEEDLFDMHKPYLMSTPEKAVLDWLYIHHSSRIARSESRRMSPPHLDLDITGINLSKMGRMAIKMGLESELAQWLESKDAYDRDDNVRNNMNLSLGY